jgi:hypothetical protein
VSFQLAVSIEGRVTEGYPSGRVFWGANLARSLMFYSRSIRQNERRLSLGTLERATTHNVSFGRL